MNLYPLLPLRDIVVFPGMVVPLFVGREKSVAALEAAMAGRQGHFPARPARSRLRRSRSATIFMTSAWSRRCCSCSSCPTAPCACWSKGSSARSLTNLRERRRFRRRPGRTARTANRRRQRSRGDDALGGRTVRRICQAQQEAARTSRRCSSARSRMPAGWPMRSPRNLSVKVSDKQALLAEPDPLKRLEMVYSLHGGRTRRAAGREARSAAA